MRTFFILVFISLVGLAVVLGTIYYGDMEKSGDNVSLPSIKLPYRSFIAGTGIVEAGSKNITIGAQVAGVVKKVYVQSGDKIKKGQLLFSIDDSKERANIAVLKASIQSALARLKSAKDQLKIIKNMKKISTGMVTNEKYIKAVDTYNEAKENVNLAKQKYEALSKKLKLYQVYAPIEGTVLRSDLTEGAYFDVHSKALVLGDDTYNVKVNINEFDTWKFQKGAKATAFIRGNPSQRVQLAYLYTIPLVAPKTHLAGSPTERTDTRVLQVMYRIKKQPDFPLYAGEMLDVFIERAKGK